MATYPLPKVGLAVVEDLNGRPMIFTSDESGNLCLISKRKDGRNEIVNLSMKFGLSQQQTLRTIAASQDLDGTVYLVFAIQEAGKADQLLVLRPMSSKVADWTALSGMGHFFSGPQEDFVIREILLGKGNNGLDAKKAYPQIHLLLQRRTMETEDIRILTINSETKQWSNPHNFKLPVNPHHVISWCLGNLSMYRGLFVLYKETEDTDSKNSMRFVGLDPEESTPVLQSISQLVTDGASQIATIDNMDGLTDLLIAGKELSWLSAGDCVRGRRKALIIDDSGAYTDTTELQVVHTNESIHVWCLSSSTLLSQEFSSNTPSTPPEKKTESIPLMNGGTSDQFAILLSPRPGQKPIVITRHEVTDMLKEARAFSNAPKVTAARETYINHLEDFIHLHEQLDEKLALVETGSKAADDKLTETCNTLQTHLTETKVASTASSVTSIIGVILLFTPLAPLGVGMTVAGVAGSVGSGVVQACLFEADASKSFTSVLNNYKSSSQELNDVIQNIEKKKELMLESLATFLTLLHTFPFPLPPKTPRPGPKSPEGTPGPPHIPNGFSTGALTGLAVRVAGKPMAGLSVKTTAELVALLGRNGGRMLTKALPVLGKTIPVLSVMIDVVSIVETWTGSNSTLESLGKLKSDILHNIEALRQAVREYHSGLEEQIGKLPLQNTLKKLLRLRKPPPGPPLSPKDCCKIVALMEEAVGTGFHLFATVMGKNNSPEAPTKHQYSVEIMPRTEVAQLSQLSICAPVIDSLYEKYPDHETYDDDDDKSLHHDGGSQTFRKGCSLVPFGDLKVYNVAESTEDRRGSGWIDFWDDFAKLQIMGGCAGDCKLEEEGISHGTRMVGGHMELVDILNGIWYILPICNTHNAPKKHDRPVVGKPSNRPDWPLLTKKGVFAVEIESLW